MTTFGKTAGDTFSMSMGLGYLAGSAIFLGALKGGRVGLNSDWQQIGGSSAGCFLDLLMWGVMQGGRSPTGVSPYISRQVHAAIFTGRLSKYV